MKSSYIKPYHEREFSCPFFTPTNEFFNNPLEEQDLYEPELFEPTMDVKRFVARKKQKKEQKSLEKEESKEIIKEMVVESYIPNQK